MNEIRKDEMFDRYIIIAENRVKRPKEFSRKKPEVKKGVCFFCPGNEHLTPPETARVPDGKGGWMLRSFWNKFPAISKDFPKAGGYHEVIVETPKHVEGISELSEEEILSIVDFYTDRMKEYYDKGSEYVLIFKNQGDLAGTSIVHAHSQLVALNFVPPLVLKEVNAMKKGRCPFCDMVGENVQRMVYEDENVFSFCPWASRSPYEIWLMPKEHRRSLIEMNGDERGSLAKALLFVMRRLDSLFTYPSFNYYLHTAPRNEDLHFHIEIIPRLTIWAGLELGGDVYINPVPPERAAEDYRGL